MKRAPFVVCKVSRREVSEGAVSRADPSEPRAWPTLGSLASRWRMRTTTERGRGALVPERPWRSAPPAPPQAVLRARSERPGQIATWVGFAGSHGFVQGSRRTGFWVSGHAATRALSSPRNSLIFPHVSLGPLFPSFLPPSASPLPRGTQILYDAEHGRDTTEQDGLFSG